MTTRRKKSWTEKLADDKDLPRTFQLEGKAAGKWGTGRMLIPAPQEVDAQMKRVRKGKVVTSTEIRAALQHHSAEAVDVVCPITTGIFCWIAANAAAEQQAQGRKNFTPYWRTLKVNGELNPKYPGGLDAIRDQLEAEGHQIEIRGKRAFVKDYEKKLAAL
ncbi:MAG: MGMT family protein [Verrucomicrobiae bacterium]|nr:MGMT family protein [Verrucomicrobiae bacterium]